jgi:hypothetical protein
MTGAQKEDAIAVTKTEEKEERKKERKKERTAA